MVPFFFLFFFKCKKKKRLLSVHLCNISPLQRCDCTMSPRYLGQYYTIPHRGINKGLLLLICTPDCISWSGSLWLL